MQETNNAKPTIFDQFHQHLIANWRIIVGISLLIVITVAIQEYRHNQHEKYEQTQAQRYEQYVSSSREVKKKLAIENKSLSYSPYHLVIALWEAKHDAEDKQWSSAIGWLTWALEKKQPQVIQDLLHYRIFTICVESDNATCMKKEHAALAKSSLAPLTDMVMGSHISLQDKKAAKEHWQRALSNTQDPLLKLITSQYLASL